MILSGLNNLLQLPALNNYYFSFNNINVGTTGISHISLCNNSGVTGLSFVLSGQNIYLNSSGANKCISSYNPNQSFSISGTYLSGSGNYNYIDFYIRDLHINSWQELLPNNLYLLNINVATGDTFNADIQFYSNPISINLNLPPSYTAFNSTTGLITSNIPLWILNSSTVFTQSYQPLLSFDTIIAPVDTSGLILNLQDLDDSSSDYEVGIISYLETNGGNINIADTINRSGNFENEINTFELLNTTSNVSGLFDGVWSGSTFIYNDFPEYSTFNFEYSIMDVLGNYDTNESVLIKFQPFAPLNNQSYTSEYITGFNLISGGFYSGVPTVNFNSYYFVTGLQQSLPSMLFSSGCSGNLPVIFSGGQGSGASGILQLLSVGLMNVYQTGLAIYNIVTGVNWLNSGTNYTNFPVAIVQTGIYGNNCYDVPAHYGSNLYSFIPFKTSGSLMPQASYLTGLILTNTGVLNGITGLYVTGMDITNIGYGYNASRPPYISFLRQSGDNLTGNATGTFLLKSNGLYNVNNYWTIYTGWTNGNFTPLVSGLSGILPNTQRFFSIELQCSGLDNTSGIVSQLNLYPSNGSGISLLITGTKYYDTDPYFLKKKLDAAQLVVPIDGQISFLTSESDLDALYANYGNSNGVSVGDNNF